MRWRWRSSGTAEICLKGNVTNNQIIKRDLMVDNQAPSGGVRLKGMTAWENWSDPDSRGAGVAKKDECKKGQVFCIELLHKIHFCDTIAVYNRLASEKIGYIVTLLQKVS